MRVLCGPICALGFALSLGGQSELPEPGAQLAQIKRTIGANLVSLPNYTCLETIERTQHKAARRPFQHIDTLHLEVAVVNNRELYSWPGANAFEDRDVGNMVGVGLISTGSFASTVSNVFVNNVSEIKWHGVEEIRDHRALRWDYTIPYDLSRWTMRIEERGGRVSESGSFWADAETLELLRLETVANEIPADLPVTNVKNTLDYARMRVGSRDLLLPQTAEVLLTRSNGAESRNRIEFSQCREFGAETRLTFDEHATVNSPASLNEFQMPAGLQFSIRMAHALDSKTAAVGDRLTAAIDRPVAYQGGILVPKGAVLKGRIRRLERQAAPRPHCLIGLEFTDIEFGGRHARFIAEMSGIQPIAGLSLVLRTAKADTRGAGMAGGVTGPRVEIEKPVHIPGVASFFMEGLAFRLPEGMQITWRTTDLKQ